MIEIIHQATEHFCENIIETPITPAKTPGQNFYGAAIALHVDNEEQQWYLLFKKETLNIFARALLLEDTLPKEELNDLVKEVANMIVGSAKVISEEKWPHKQFKIDTPDFLGHVPRMELLELEEFLLYKIRNRTFVIGKKVVT